MGLDKVVKKVTITSAKPKADYEATTSLMSQTDTFALAGFVLEFNMVYQQARNKFNELKQNEIPDFTLYLDECQDAIDNAKDTIEKVAEAERLEREK
jgi:hypothetical protein